ncbi:alpha/beta fold hydrolase [Larkinella sp. VNQ87]|uniref:alpha/beta fold hydrolase n=1 Tax=Larkinella sp. VNQ87 TaxID=3400921 RepID=UPI003C07D433
MKCLLYRKFLPVLWVFLPVWGWGQSSTVTQPLSITLENYAYPYPTMLFPARIEGQNVRMAFMDVKPTGTVNGQTVMLLHGKNFGGYYWKNTIATLTQQGFRVIVPDQIGFGRSSKPIVDYSFHLLASITKALLDSLDIRQTVVVGHSMGGMVATRFALLYPQTVSKLVLENPIGLEDYRPYVPYRPIEAIYRSELNNSETSLRNYQKSYYVQWKPEYEEWVRPQAGMLYSSDYPRFAMTAALTFQMIYEQPVCYEFPYLKMPTLLVIGQADRTVVGKALVGKENLEKVGQYPELGKRTAKLIPKATLVELPQVGHIPHIEAPDQFHQALTGFLKK